MNRLRALLLFSLAAITASAAPITITFRHYPSLGAVQRAYVPGTFNNWGPNASGVIAIDAPSRMTWVDSLGCFIKSYLFNTGEVYNYKLHEHRDAAGTQWQWFTDPLNPLVNTADNNNSILQVEPLMLFQLSPRSGALITEQNAPLSFGAFVVEGDSLLAGASTITVDGQVTTTFEQWLIPELGIVRYPLPALGNGQHCAVVRLVTRSGAVKTDSTSFALLAGDMVFMTPSCDSVWASEKTIRWRINRDPAQLKSVVFYQSGKTATAIPIEQDGEYERNALLGRGSHTFVIGITDLASTTQFSDTLRLRYPLPQHPQPAISLQRSADKIKITGTAQDPQRKSISFRWSAAATNALPLPDLDGKTDPNLEIAVPAAPGEYAFKLTATDADGFSLSAGSFFIVQPGGAVVLPDRNTSPQWVRESRIYCLFFKSFTPQGTIAAAADRLEYIKKMGFNAIWVLPVMDVEGVIDQGSNIGYNIIDFNHVDPVYGTDADFRSFVNRAHELGLRVILDVTPNHSSRSHPIALDVRANRKYSRYYDFYQHEPIDHDTNGLGQSVSSDGVVYYSGFSDALLNWNWSDPEARTYMIEVYKYWLREFDIDGFRFDVWWGPHRRYGRANFDQPLRLALRTVKADILLLGETHGTGSGSEENYADLGGGMDMGYDWQLKDTILPYPSAASLESRLYNSGFRPGPNSFFLRFLENQDEDRVIYRYGSADRTLPASTALFMATGTPLLYAGQETGMGYNISGLDARRRGTINWASPLAAQLTPHYQKLAQIRAQFPAFRAQFEDSDGDRQITGSDRSVQIRLDGGSVFLYAMARPYADANGLALMNFSSAALNIDLPLKPAEWMLFSGGFRPEQSYYLNNLYAGTTRQLTGADLDTLKLTLPAYGVAIYTIATSAQQVLLPDLINKVEQHADGQRPERFHLAGSFPNPFNSASTIRFSLPAAGEVEAEIFNALGQRIRVLGKSLMQSGAHDLLWDGCNQRGESSPSGLYFLRLRHSGGLVLHKMALIR